MHYHLIGIGGTAMASLAGMLQTRGCLVTGSDQNVYPPMSVQLEQLGIRFFQGYRAENLTATGAPPDCVVIGNALSRGNPEVEAVLNMRLVYRSMAETVKEEFIRRRRSLVVTGTHGKTTTTSLAAWVMEQGGLNPTFLVGGVAQNFNASFRVTESPYFVIEGDEYDTAYFDKGAKFFHYLPELGIVGNIEFDHADIYSDLAAIKLAFRRFINLIPSQGRLIAGWDNLNVRDIVREMGGNLYTRLETFGTCDGAMWQAHSIEIEGARTRFQVRREGKSWGEFVTPLVGEFNVRNCLAVIVAADAWGVERAAIADALASFQSVKRRLEVRGEAAGVTIIDDFAHHPTAVRETLKALREKYRGRRLIAVFEPRSFTSRVAVFQEDYVNALAQADYAIVAGVFNAKRKAAHAIANFDLLDTAELCEQICERGTHAFNIASADEIISHLAPELRAGDVVAVMSNGGFDNIHEKLLTTLARKEAAIENQNVA
jgi:UDP-N-acetylmuramate: L-alanyl-gamma-D-glutamyl-meso-diaminopimelate ligase